MQMLDNEYLILLSLVPGECTPTQITSYIRLRLFSLRPRRKVGVKASVLVKIVTFGYGPI